MGLRRYLVGPVGLRVVACRAIDGPEPDPTLGVFVDRVDVRFDTVKTVVLAEIRKAPFLAIVLVEPVVGPGKDVVVTIAGE